MCSEMKVEVIHRETVPPSSTNPHHRTTSNLSIFYQFMPDMYGRLLLFYRGNSSVHEFNNGDHNQPLISERSKLLKTSLSETLSRYYLLAGRISIQNNLFSICYNDNGALFIEARVNCPISKILGNPDEGAVSQLLPTTVLSTNENTGYLFLVQANFFTCGGLAIGISISHKAADALTLGAFIRSWAAIGLGSGLKAVPAVEFGAAASISPPQDFFINSSQPSMQYVHETCKTRRLVFDASKIASLKSKAVSATIPNPTRVEVVSALIWKCAMEASRSNSGSTRPAIWIQAENMRTVLRKPNLMGNAVGVSAAKTEESEENLQSLVAKLRKGSEDIKAKYGNGLSGNDVCYLFKEYGNLMGKNYTDTYNCTSCRFGFYEANFGWGKPSWVTIPGAVIKNVIFLLDTRDGDGIEAIMSFKEEDMAVIETNKELLVYASLNPTCIRSKL